MCKFLLAIVLFSSIAAMAQTTVFYTDRALGVGFFTQNGQTTPAPIVQPFAWVRVCTIPYSGSPCTPVASITDIFGNPLSVMGGNFGQLQADNVGRFSFGCTNGLYQIQIQATTSNTPLANYPITCPSGGGTAGVSSFAGRSGAITPAATDYTALKQLNNVFKCDQFPGADAGVQISNCIAAVVAQSSYGGVADATGIQGAQTVASGNWFNCTPGASSCVTSYGVTLLLGPATYTIGSQLTIPAYGVRIKGICRGEAGALGSRCTTIQASTSFPASTPVVRAGEGVNAGFDNWIENLGIDCNSAATNNGTMVGYYSTDIQEKAGMRNVLVSSCGNIGILVDGRSTGNCFQSPCNGVAQNWSFDSVEILPTNAVVSQTTSKNLIVYCTNNFSSINNSTFNGAASGANTIINTAIELDGCSGGELNHIHIERALNGIVLGNNVTGLTNSGDYGTVLNDINTNSMCTGTINQQITGCPTGTGTNENAIVLNPGNGGGLSTRNITINGLSNNGTAQNNILDNTASVAIAVPSSTDLSTQHYSTKWSYHVGQAFLYANVAGTFDNLTLVGGGSAGTDLPTIILKNSGLASLFRVGSDGSVGNSHLASLGALSLCSGITTVPCPTANIRFGISTTGIQKDTTGFKHIRGVAGCATAASAGATCQTTITWTTAFADANYTASCVGNTAASGVPVNGGIQSKLAASVQFSTVAGNSSAAQYTTIECEAWHD